MKIIKDNYRITVEPRDEQVHVILYDKAGQVMEGECVYPPSIFELLVGFTFEGKVRAAIRRCESIAKEEDRLIAQAKKVVANLEPEQERG